MRIRRQTQRERGGERQTQTVPDQKERVSVEREATNGSIQADTMTSSVVSEDPRREKSPIIIAQGDHLK